MSDAPIAPVPPIVPPATPPSAERPRHWLLFFVVLLTPAVLTMLTNHGATSGFSFFSLFCLTPVAGIVCAALTLPRHRSIIIRVLLGVPLAIALWGVSFALCFAGCAITAP